MVELVAEAQGTAELGDLRGEVGKELGDVGIPERRRN
jgi:hypothetical protein